MKTLVVKFKAVKKAAVAAVGLVAQVVASGVLTGAALHWAQGVLAVATLLGVYGVRNVVVVPSAPVAPVAPVPPAAPPTA